MGKGRKLVHNIRRLPAMKGLVGNWEELGFIIIAIQNP
jgi:hypothetical protein